MTFLIFSIKIKFESLSALDYEQPSIIKYTGIKHPIQYFYFDIRYCFFISNFELKISN